MHSLDKNDAIKDWSLVVWGDKGPVYVYNKDGSKTNDWGKSDSMKKLASGPKGKPAAWNSAGKEAMPVPNEPKEVLNEVRSANIAPAKIEPARIFRHWAA